MDASASAVSSPPSSSNEEDDEEYASEAEDARRTKRKRGGAVANKAVRGQELWRPGVKTGLGPGKQVFIALPKARGDGGVRYQDGKIHPNTMDFLRELRENNDREWLKGESLPSIIVGVGY